MPALDKDQRIVTGRYLITFAGVLLVVGLWLLWSVSWKIAVGVVLFGWAMNISNEWRGK